MSLKQLGAVKDIVESAGMAISYAYDDLVFVDHNAFLLQFTSHDKELLIHINTEADESKVEATITRLKIEATARKMIFRGGSNYTLSQSDNENINLEFV